MESIREERKVNDVTVVRVLRNTADRLHIMKRKLRLRNMDELINLLIVTYVKYQRIKEKCPEVVNSCEQRDGVEGEKA